MQAFPPAEVQILKTAARRFAFGFPNALSGHYPHARAGLAHLNPGPGGPEGIGYHLFRETAASQADRTAGAHDMPARAAEGPPGGPQEIGYQGSGGCGFESRRPWRV